MSCAQLILTWAGVNEDVALFADTIVFTDRLPVLCGLYVPAPGILALFPIKGGS